MKMKSKKITSLISSHFRLAILFLAVVGIVAASSMVLGEMEMKSSTKDEEAIKKSAADFAAAWNKNDAKAIAMLFAEDGDFVNPEGRMSKGRAGIEKNYTEVFATTFKGTKFTSTVDLIRFVKPDVAISDGTYEIVGAHGPDGKEMPPIKGLYTIFGVKKNDKWWMVSGRAMVPLTPPAQPAQKK